MNLLTDLMPHQREAVEKIERSRVGALFMDMGTGKSRTAIELVHRKEERISKVVWFCPVSLKETVRREIFKHAPGEEVFVFDSKVSGDSVPRARWYVVGIESMSTSARVIQAAMRVIDSKAMVIVDESSYIKGPRSARTRWITQVSKVARYRLILTGTPMSQGFQDLYAQMYFLSPKILGYRSFYSFAANHLEYHPDYPGMVVRAHNTGWLAAKIAPYTYQVTKDECLDLPSKLYEERWFSMTDVQREYYEAAKERALAEWEGDEDSELLVFKIFSWLQQILSGYWWPDKDKERIVFEHRRLKVLGAVLEDIGKDEKVIVWAKLHWDVEAIMSLLGDAAVPFYGSMSEGERNEALDAWRGEGKRVLVATPGCGGHGLTLNEARFSIFYNNEFKYAHRSQAEDRNHRIGQERAVTYLDLACSGSLDERILDCLSRKEDAAREFRDKVAACRDKKTVKQAIKSL